MSPKPLLRYCRTTAIVLLIIGIGLTWTGLKAEGSEWFSLAWTVTRIILLCAGLSAIFWSWTLFRGPPAPQPKPPARKLSWKLCCVFVATLWGTLFIGGEILLRITGSGPWPGPLSNISSIEPKGRLCDPDPIFGHKNRVGRFRITHSAPPPLPDYTWTCTHGSDTYRITSTAAPPEGGTTNSRPEIWIFGCSFGYGYAVSDEETFAWLLQAQLPDYRVVNMAVNCYGTLHGLLQLRAGLAAGRKPAAVVVAYASFHDCRNTFARSWRKAFVPPNADLGPLLDYWYPVCARLDAAGKPEVVAAEYEYTPWWGIRQSAVLHAFERVYNALEDIRLHNHDVAKAILQEMADLCAANGAQLIVAGLTPDAATADTLSFCQGHGIRTVDIAVNVRAAEYNNLPYDSHPNAKAHALYAEKLYPFLHGALPAGNGQ